MAPQQPKKAVMKMRAPITMRRMGGRARWYLSGMKSSTWLFLIFSSTPTARSASPANCKANSNGNVLLDFERNLEESDKKLNVTKAKGKITV